MAFNLGKITDMTCSLHICRNTSEMLFGIYAAVIAFLMLAGATTGKQTVKAAFEMMNYGDGNKQKQD